MSNPKLFNTFGEDVESDEEDFNPAAATVSDDEDDGGGKDVRSQRRTGQPVTGDEIANSTVTEDEVGNERRKQKDERRAGKAGEGSLRRVGAADEADRDDIEDEGSGEDIAGANGDEDEDEDEEEEEEDEEEDEDEEEVHGHRRKRKRTTRNQFIEEEAVVDDEDEEVEDEEEDFPGGDRFVADTHPDDEGLDAGEEQDDRRHRELDLQRQRLQEEDAEAQAQRFKERYGRNRLAPVNTSVMPKRMLLPSVNDPTIWGVKVKQGKEREVVFSVMRRLEERANTRDPLQITAAFERGGTMAGFVYVEARKQADVQAAMADITFAYPRSKMVLVPIGEMPDLLRVHKSKRVEPGTYVRIKRGKYTGDLAQVIEVETNGLTVDVRVVPRLDYGQNEDNASSATIIGADGIKRKRPGFGKNSAISRPPPRLFNEHEARKRHGRHLMSSTRLGEKRFTYLGDSYADGFLEKPFRIQHLQTENVNPTLEEVTRFTSEAEDGTENLDLSAIAATLKVSNTHAQYLPGDMVEVYHGEQQGVIGKAISVHSDIVTLRVTEGELQGQTIEAPIRGLRKKFSEGDHVKVVGASKYQDEVGMVVRIKDDRITILSDSNNQELTVFSKDLREASDSTITLQSSKHDLYDLVQLDPSTVACVVKVDRESLRVLDQNGSVRTVLPSSISAKLEKRRFAVATDRDGTEIHLEDTVREIGGEQRTGRVMYIHRVYLFLRNREILDNAGVFVARTSGVLTVAAKGGGITGAAAATPDLNKINPAIFKNNASAANGSMAPPPQRMGPDRYLGRSCKIRGGTYKGLVGIVKDTTATEARIELHAKNKIVTVPKERLTITDSEGKAVDMSRFGGPPRSGPASNYGGPRAPMAFDNSARTPAYAAGSHTPAWASGNKTPGWSRAAAGSRTPAAGWADGSRTVDPYSAGSGTAYGGQTSYGGMSTWNANSSGTPHHASFGAGSRTPAFAPSANAGGRTPAWASSRTPGGGGGATSFEAPTPAALDMPTPRAFNPYATNSTAAAQTPAAYAAPTPAGGVEDEGYE